MGENRITAVRTDTVVFPIFEGSLASALGHHYRRLRLGID
jgi:hypothetical protein